MMCSPQDTPNAGMNTQGSTKIVLELSVEENGAIACRTAPYNDECCENGENNAIDGFSDFEVRQRFKTRVYSLLTCQLLILISICLSVNEILHLFRLDGEIAIKTIVFTSFIQVLMVVVVYCNRGKWLRVFPANFLVLSTFTFANAVSISVADNAFRCNVLLYSIQVISLAFLVLTIFAAQNWIKYSWCRALLLATIILLPALTLIEYITQDASTPRYLNQATLLKVT
ncbi:Hypothetical predicted protein [Cloeon dipterum]|uniref:Uncharacterized protein n=1 Tax=Cloeon dipterum TaxID=197152 RepID=A0A8S1CRU0_9INSE|nr:Hypothetical predicted protein [Cloeon dipterum]